MNRIESVDSELVEMCSCPEIHTLWDPKPGDIYWCRAAEGVALLYDLDIFNGSNALVGIDGKVYLPCIEKLITELGTELYKIEHYVENNVSEWCIELHDMHDDFWGTDLRKLLVQALQKLKHNKIWSSDGWIKK